jgi:glutamate racemase
MRLGLFDSGLGGLTVLARVRERLPHADVVFFADQANVPYGDRTHGELLKLLRANIAYLDGYGVDAIVMACNTSCAIAERYGWPKSRAPMLDLIDSAAIAVERGGFLRVGIVATAATVGARSYGRTLRARIGGVDVVEVPAPALVPLVEAGSLDGEATRAAVAEVCTHLPLDLEALVFGCTHYPVLERHFRGLLGTGVVLIDPAIVQAERAAELLANRGPGTSTTNFVTSGDRGAFAASFARLTGAAPSGEIRHYIPGIAYSDENEQQHAGGDDEKSGCAERVERDRSRQDRPVRHEREDAIPDPILYIGGVDT